MRKIEFLEVGISFDVMQVIKVLIKVVKSVLKRKCLSLPKKNLKNRQVSFYSEKQLTINFFPISGKSNFFRVGGSQYV